jgi:hypothetical protein
MSSDDNNNNDKALKVLETTEITAERNEKGRFVKGNSAGSRRMQLREDVRALLVDATPKAAKAMIDCLDAEFTNEFGTFANHDMRLKAANAIMDRICGKPAQQVVGEDGGPIRHDVAIIAVLRKLAGESSDEP